MEYIVEAKNLVKKYKDFTAINNLNMHIEKGSIYGFVGKNGAGKTTFIRLLCGLQEPTDGEILIYGISNKDKNVINSRKRLGAIIESPAIYPEMTAEENLQNQYRILGIPSFRGLDQILETVGLSNTGDKKAKDFSLGMRQRLGIAIALAGNPDFIILDEPINGLDPQGIIEIRELILKLNKEKNITILISSHILDELSKLATHYGFIDKGRIIKEISSRELEEICKKGYSLNISNLNDAIRYFETNQIQYKVIDNENINIYGDMNIGKVILDLAKQDCFVVQMHEYDETLESYFMNLVGGDDDE